MADNVREFPTTEQVKGQLERLKNSGGGGTYDGMEERVRHLETDMSYIKGKLEDMPTKDWVTTRLIWVVLAVGSIGALVEAAGRLIP